MPRKIPAAIIELVRERAAYRCEYCHTNERWQAVRFTTDHVKPVVLGGEDTIDNLALACFHCNRRKWRDVTALDSETGQTVPLFNPREDSWADHFVWSADGLRILPLTGIGRATVGLLELNRERILYIRAADVSVGRHPPKDDPMQEQGEHEQG